MDRVGPPLSDEEYIRLYSRSKISLGFSSVAELPSRGEPIKQVRLRDFEAPMSGAFYMVEYLEELAEFFTPDKEIVCFTGPEDLVEKARYYLAHDGERERIRKAGMQRARNEHTWHKRFEMVFRQIGLG
jgi:spore maturation protein CgeB